MEMSKQSDFLLKLLELSTKNRSNYNNNDEKYFINTIKFLLKQLSSSDNNNSKDIMVKLEEILKK